MKFDEFFFRINNKHDVRILVDEYNIIVKRYFNQPYPYQIDVIEIPNVTQDMLEKTTPGEYFDLSQYDGFKRICYFQGIEYSKEEFKRILKMKAFW